MLANIHFSSLSYYDKLVLVFMAWKIKGYVQKVEGFNQLHTSLL